MSPKKWRVTLASLGVQVFGIGPMLAVRSFPWGVLIEGAVIGGYLSIAAALLARYP